MTISIGDIFSSTLRLTAADSLLAFGLIVALTLFGTLGDVYAPDAVFLLGVAIVVVHFFVLRRIVTNHHLASGGRLGGFGGFFGVGILTGLGILCGALLLVLPGLYLAARWSMANTALIAEDCGVSTAMARSWQGTKGSGLAVTIALVLVLVPGIAGAVIMGAMGYFDMALTDGGPIGLDALANGLVSLSQVVSWYFEVALYALLVGSPNAALDEVFA